MHHWNVYVLDIKRRKDVNGFLGYNFWDDGSGSLANRCLLYRIDNRLTIENMAKRIGINPTTLERVENGQTVVKQTGTMMKEFLFRI